MNKSSVIKVLLICIIASTVLGGVICGCGPDHNHEFVQVQILEASTCSKLGKAKEKCRYCDETREVDLPMLSHKFEEETIPATCTEEGAIIQTCVNCGAEKSTPIKPTGHKTKAEVTTEPTCIAKGVRSYICTVCKQTVKTEDIPMLKHEYAVDEASIQEAPTCTTDGYGTYKCVNGCEDTYDDVIPALGHDVSSAWTFDLQPTYDSEGLRSHHCTRCNYFEDQESVPRLPLEYIVALRRSTTGGRSYPIYTPAQYPVIYFLDAEGNEVGHAEACGTSASQDGSDDYVNYDVAIIELPADTYTLRIDNMPAGYTLIDETVQVTRSSPKVIVYFTVDLVDAQSDAEVRYAYNSVLKDCELINIGQTEATDKKVMLSELLSQHKGILINLFSVTMQHSMNEMSYIQSVYRSVGDDVAIVCISTIDSLETIRDFRKTPSKYEKQMSLDGDFPFIYYSPDLAAGFNYSGNKNKTPASFYVSYMGVIEFLNTTNGLTSDRHLQLINSQIIKIYDDNHPNATAANLIWKLPEAVVEKKYIY